MNYKKLIRKLLSVLPDIPYVKIQYRYLTGRNLNLKHPVRYNEKVQWIKLYDHNPLYTTMVDKYKVKEYVSSIIGDKFVVPLIGVWDRPEDICLEKLPDRFVLKTNHDSKGVVICKDKDKFDFEAACVFLNKHLRMNGFDYGREWPYKNIERKIIAEKYIEDESGGLQDYKVMCFNGEPKIVQLHQGRFTNHYSHDLYDTEWNLQSFNQVGETSSAEPASKPAFLNQMLDLSRKLSNGISHVRIDWYYAEGQLFFGEITFFDASGYLDFIPDEVNYTLGNWITLPTDGSPSRNSTK